MPAMRLDEVDAVARELSRDEQLELARRLLNRSVPSASAPHSILEWSGAGKGTWKTADEVDRYIEEERRSWQR